MWLSMRERRRHVAFYTMDFDRRPTVPEQMRGKQVAAAGSYIKSIQPRAGLVTETISQPVLSAAFLATTRLIPGAERRGMIRSMPNRVGESQLVICSTEKVPERLVIAK